MHALFHGKIKKIVKLPNFPWDDILRIDKLLSKYVYLYLPTLIFSAS